MVDRDKQLASIHRLSVILAQMDIPHWIDFGTLLGAVREGGLIDGDVDVDFDFFEVDRARILSLRKTIENETGLVLIPSEVIRFCPRHQGLHLQHEFAAITSCINAGMLYVDFYPCTIENFTVKHSLPPFSFRKHFIDELKQTPIDQLQFPCPRHRSQLCLHRYGNTWKKRIGYNEYKINEFSYIEPFKDQYVAILVVLPGDKDVELAVQKAKQVFDIVFLGLISNYNSAHLVEPGFRESLAIQTGCAIREMPPEITLDVLDRHGIDFIVSTRANEEVIKNIAPAAAEHGRVHALRVERMVTGSLLSGKNVTS